MYKSVSVLAAIVTIFAWMPVYIQGNEPPIPDPPAEGAYILDTLNWLTTKQEEQITIVISQLEKDGLAVIAVVTLNDCGTNKQQFRKKLFASWGIGNNDKDGLLILVCWYDGDQSRRSVEQEYGAGLGKILSSKITDQIAQEQFVPAFQRDHPGNGLIAMVQKYDTVIRKGPIASNTSSTTNSGNDWLFLILIAAILLILAQKGGNWWASNNDQDSGGGYFNDRENYQGGDRDSGGSGGGSSTKF